LVVLVGVSAATAWFPPAFEFLDDFFLAIDAEVEVEKKGGEKGGRRERVVEGDRG
jgi:hypothetical protein